MNRKYWKVWGAPIGIGISSSVGLVSALTGDGIFDSLSWLTLGLPVGVTLFFLWKKKQPMARVKSK